MRVTHYVLQSGFSTALTTTPGFRRNPLQPVPIWPSSQTSCLWHPTTLTRVCPKWRPWRMLRHLRPSETAFPSAAFWRKGTKTSHRGLSQVNMVGGWPAEHHWWLQCLVFQLLCARWHCHDGTVDHGHQLGDAVYTMPGRQWFTYQSALTVFLSLSGMLATWPNFAKKHSIICLEAILFLLNFTAGFSSGKAWEYPQRQLLLPLGVVLVHPGFVSCYDVLNARRPSSVTFS